MNILFFGWEFPPRGGGVGAYMMHMARALVYSGHTAIMVTGRMPGHAETEQIEGVTTYRIYEKEQQGDLNLMRQVLKIAEKHNIDWIEGADHLGECAGLLKIKRRAPVVIKSHGCSALKFLRDSHVLKFWQKPIILLSLLRQHSTIVNEKYCLQNADLLLTPSWRMACELKKIRWKITSNLSVVPNTLITDFPQIREENSRPTLLFVGRIDIGKGIQWLPSIMKNLKEKNVCLEIAGDDSYARGIGSLKKWLERKLSEVQVDVRFLGKVNQELLAEAYQRAWVVVMPSRWDNFPTVILEAMKYGKPVVSSPYGGMVEMLSGTMSRISLPESPDFSSQIDAFLSDKSLRQEAGASMKEKLRKDYSPQQVVSQYIKAVRSSLSL